MSGRVIVLGAASRIGRAAAEAFRDAGWTDDLGLIGPRRRGRK